MVLKTILHIDFDSFFASVEQQYNPSLRNKPIGVTATNGRTCIIAASREAKRFGIKTASRTFEAQKVCPSIVFVPADFVKYYGVSKKFIAICKDYSPHVELFSIDELFIDITQTAHLFGGVSAVVERIKKRIREEIGEYITVSIGISHNKLLAKLASGINKPNGIGIITPDTVEAVYKTAQLTDICGIGERIKNRLHKIGIYTLLQLRQASLPWLIAEFGKAEGQFLKYVGMGYDPTALIPYTAPPSVKSVGRNYCLPKNEYNKRIVLQNMFELCEEVCIKLRRLGKKARTIGFSLRGSVTTSCRKTYSTYFDTGQDFFRRCLAFVPAWQDNEYVRQISVWSLNLEDASKVPLSLWENNGKEQYLWQAVDKINEKFGDHTIRHGFLLNADKLTTVPNGWMADKYERTKLAQSPI